jgi:hypothetical protein
MKSSSQNKESKLQKEISALKALLRALNSENLRLQKKIATAEAKHLSDRNRIIVLEKELEGEKKKPTDHELIALIKRQESKE